MSRGRRKRPPRRRRPVGRRRSRTSYRDSLVGAIREWFPPQFFGQWKLRRWLLWTPQRILWMALLMVCSAEQTLTSRFAAVADVLQTLFPRWKPGRTYTGWYEAQAKWLQPLRQAAAKRLRQHMRQQSGAYWQRYGWCAFAADGSRVECPRTEANEKELKCAGKKKTTPQLFLTTLWHMGTGLPWDFRIGPGTASERRHLEDMLGDLPRRSLIVADAGFWGFDFYSRINAADQHFLMRVGSNVRLLKELGYCEFEDDSTVYLWPDERRDEAPVVLRLIVLWRGEQAMYLVTNVFDEAALGEKTAALLYEMRWGVEIFSRSTKQTLQKRKMLSHTPEAAECELTWAVLGIWLLGWMSVAGIIKTGGDPLCWSVARARERVREAMRRCLTRQHCQGTLPEQLARAIKDDYQRRGSKKARDWPHKKKEMPPGSPKITEADEQQKLAARKVKSKKVAA
jgi:hypothetical protein